MTDKEAFEAWFQARWPEFAHPTTSAFEIWQAATAAERERCAEICDGIGDGNRWSDAHSCADAIRRGE